MQYNKYSPANKDNPIQNLHDHFQICRESSLKSLTTINDKIPKKIMIERTYIKLMYSIYIKPTVNIFLNYEKLKLFSLKYQTRMLTAKRSVQ